jgi:hypothetical protein
VIGSGAYRGFTTGLQSRGAHGCEEQWYTRDPNSISTCPIYKILLHLSSKPSRLWASWPMLLGQVGRLLVPIVPNLISSPRVQETWYPCYQTSSAAPSAWQASFSPIGLVLPILAKLPSALLDLKWFIECYLALVEC